MRNQLDVWAEMVSANVGFKVKASDVNLLLEIWKTYLLTRTMAAMPQVGYFHHRIHLGRTERDVKAPRIVAMVRVNWTPHRYLRRRPKRRGLRPMRNRRLYNGIHGIRILQVSIPPAGFPGLALVTRKGYVLVRIRKSMRAASVTQAQRCSHDLPTAERC